ncbi:MAG: ribosome small subunit-dependent GTPase A [Actinomycetales bacterium]
MARSLDEDDVRSRPGRHKSRPRSKDRPTHETAVLGTVTTVDRGRFTVALDDDRLVHAVKARELGRKGIVVGDRVDLVGDSSGDPGTQARIIRRTERTSALRRTADDSDPVERVIVANATQLAVVSATTNPAPNLALIDRAMVAALDAGLRPLLILTKADLASPDDVEQAYGALREPPLHLGIFVVANRSPSEDLRTALTGQTTVMLGESGVGKSTLVNALVPGTNRSTGHVNLVTGKGRHTSTSVLALRLSAGGWIIDTPGVRSFGLGHVDRQHILGGFPEFAELLNNCPRSCSHDEAECALTTWEPNQPEGVQVRVRSLRRLLGTLQERTST